MDYILASAIIGLILFCAAEEWAHRRAKGKEWTAEDILDREC